MKYESSPDDTTVIKEIRQGEKLCRQIAVWRFSYLARKQLTREQRNLNRAADTYAKRHNALSAPYLVARGADCSWLRS